MTTHIYSAANRFATTKTVPLATYGAAGRFAVLYISSQGWTHTSEVLNSYTGWTLFQDLSAGDLGNGNRPRVWGLYRQLTDSMSDYTIDHNNYAGGWMVSIYSGNPDFVNLIETSEFNYAVAFGDATVATVGTGDGIRVGILATNFNGACLSPATAVAIDTVEYGAPNGASYEINTNFTAGTSPAFTPQSNTDYTLSWVFVPVSSVAVPGTPMGLGASPGNTEVDLTWSAPANNGGSAITDYLIEYDDGGGWATFADGISTAVSTTVTGLTNNVSHDFRVSATNSAGTGSPSSTATTTPIASPTVPGAPTNLTVTPGDGQITASWTAPASNGGSAITDYVVEFNEGGAGWEVFADAVNAVTSTTITGLTNGFVHDVRVKAKNAIGTGTASAVSSTTPGATPTSLAIVHVQAEHGDNTRTIPLATWAGAGRKAIVIVSWQGVAHGSADMGAVPAPFTEISRQARPTDYTPAMAVWSADITTASDVDLPITHGGCGFVLWVVTGVTSLLVADSTNGTGTYFGILGQGYDLTLAAVATNAQKTVGQTGGYTLTAPPPHYSEPAGAHLFGGGDGSLTWDAPSDFWAGITIGVTGTVYQTVWTRQPTIIVTGNVTGSGLGDDVTSIDTNGVTNTPGSNIEFVVPYSANPPGPSNLVFKARAGLPASYDPTAGYAITYQLEDASANVTKVEAELPPQSGDDKGLIAGETKVFSSGALTGLTWNDGGATPHIRVKLTAQSKDVLRPVLPPDPDPDPDPGPGTVGRLGRPRMVELWRSQGETAGGPTLTNPDRWVDPINGNDGNNGLTEGAAWRSMAHAINQTTGLGVGIGYKSGTISSPVDINGAGSGTNFANRVNTHYVLEGHDVVFQADWRFTDAMKIQHCSYMQWSGFRILNTTPTSGGNTDVARYGLNIQDYNGQNDSHHHIIADMVADGMAGSGLAGYGTRYLRMLGCEIYDCGWWTYYGGSGTTFNNADRPPDSTPAGYINGSPVDIWIQSCYISGSRQKVDSRFIQNGSGGYYYNATTDGNAYAVDFWHNGQTWYYPMRTAMINCIAHNTGGKSFNTFNAGDEWWFVNCVGAYGGRHIEYVNTPGDPIQGFNPLGQAEYIVQQYQSMPGQTAGSVHWWNCAAVAGSWMGGSQAFNGGWGVNISEDAQNNKRTNGYSGDSWSSVMGDPLFVNSDQNNGKVFDPRPQAGSPLLSGGNLALLNACEDDQGNKVTTDFAGTGLAASGSGHVGPYSTAT